MAFHYSFTRIVAVAALACVHVARSAVVDLPIIFDNSYASVPVQIGSPPSTYRLMFDTGSSSAWVNAAGCTECPNTSGYQRVPYDEAASSTAVSLGAFDEIDYLSGSLTGSAVEDLFSFASANGEVTWNQTFLDVNQSTPWPFITADGFLGLAFSTIAANDTKTAFETLMQKGLVDEPRFSIYYGKEFNTTGDNPEGVMTLGGSKEDQYVNGSVTYIPLHVEEYEVWRVAINSATTVSKSNASVNPVTTTIPIAGYAVFDTGTGIIEVPPDVIDDLYESIGYNYTDLLGGKTKPLCSQFSSWSVTFVFGGSSSITISGDQLAQPGFAYSNDYCFPPFSDSGVAGFTLIGTPFLTQFYSIWDFGSDVVAEYTPRIGFGSLNDIYKP